MINIILNFSDLNYEKYKKLVDLVHDNPLIDRVICEDLPRHWEENSKFGNTIIGEDGDEYHCFWYNKELLNFFEEMEKYDPYKVKTFITYCWQSPAVQEFIKKLKAWY